MKLHRLISLWLIISILWIAATGWWVTKNWLSPLPQAMIARCSALRHPDWCDAFKGTDADPLIEDAARRTNDTILVAAVAVPPFLTIGIGAVIYWVGRRARRRSV